jgi:hypothetical protein
MLSTFLKIPYLRLKYRFLPNQAQEFWAQELLNSQGLSAKLGQILAQGKETSLPKGSLSPETAKKIFFQSFSKDISVSSEVMAASMGQVFFIHIDQQEFALKILHPGIKEKLKKEIDNILLLGGYFGKAKGFSFDKEVFKRFLVEVFEEETDLSREAHFQEKFSFLFKDHIEIKIPQVIKEYSNSFVLCQEKILSTLARDSKHFSGFSIFHFFFDALLLHGTLHGDLNDRNWGYTAPDKIVVYDYGCVQIISERRILGFKKLLMNEDIVNGFKEFGVRLEATWFKGQEQKLRDALFSPLLNQDIPPEWSYSQELQGQFGEKIKQLREFTDPWVLLMMRSLFSLIRIYQDRKIPIPLGFILKPYLIIHNEDSKESSKNIKIEVLEGTSQVVFLSLPMTALDNLENLMPDNVLLKIHEASINLPTIIERVKSSSFLPQDLFSLQVDKRSYRVWID